MLGIYCSQNQIVVFQVNEVELMIMQYKRKMEECKIKVFLGVFVVYSFLIVDCSGLVF